MNSIKKLNPTLVVAIISGLVLLVLIGATQYPRQYNYPTSYPDITEEPTGTRFAVIGDYGDAGASAANVADMVKQWQPDFIVTTGDNNYEIGSQRTIDTNIGQYYSEYISPYHGSYVAGVGQNRFFPVLGNHDWLSNNAQPYLNYFPIDESTANTQSSNTERYYDFIQGSVHFFMLESVPDNTDYMDEQVEWLREQISQSETAWQIVVMHHAPYSSGARHGSHPSLQYPYQEWGVDAVLAGHDHVYERFNIDGIPYFVNGLGGKSLRRFKFTPEPNSESRFSQNYGAMFINAIDTQLSFAFYSIGNSTQPIDYYTTTNLPTQ